MRTLFEKRVRAPKNFQYYFLFVCGVRDRSLSIARKRGAGSKGESPWRVQGGTLPGRAAPSLQRTISPVCVPSRHPSRKP